MDINSLALLSDVFYGDWGRPDDENIHARARRFSGESSSHSHARPSDRIACNKWPTPMIRTMQQQQETDTHIYYKGTFISYNNKRVCRVLHFVS